MAGYIKTILLCLLIFFFTTMMFSGITMPIIPMYFIATLIVLSIGVLMTQPFLNFLTIQINFLTYFLMSAIIITGITFLLKIFMTGFFIESSDFAGISLDFLEIKGFEINAIFTIILFSILSAFISTVFYILEKSD